MRTDPAVTDRRWKRDTRSPQDGRSVIGHRFAELGKESVIPWHHRRSSMALRRVRRSYLYLR